jgi:hypothetical protein
LKKAAMKKFCVIDRIHLAIVNLCKGKRAEEFKRTF